MIRLFKNTRILFIFLSAVGIVGFLYEGIGVISNWHWNPSPSLFVFYSIILIAYLYIIVGILEIIANVEFKIIGRYLHEKCDPLKFIQSIQKKTYLNNKNHINTRVKIMLFNAYLDLNQIDEAKSILETVTYFNNDAVGILNQHLYNCSLLNYYIFTKNIEKAESTFDEVLSFIKCNSSEFKIKDIYERTYEAFFSKLQMVKENYDGLEQYYVNEFSTCKSMLNRVNVKYGLGKIYEHYHEMGKAKEAFEYVVHYGNKLYIAQKAKEYLEQLQNFEEKDYKK